jgi:hypothetical protein
MSQATAGADRLTACPAPVDLAARLISGAELPAGADARLALAYTIVVLEWVDASRAGSVTELFDDPDALHVPTLAGAVVLLPDHGDGEPWTVTDIAARLGGRAWGAVANRSRLDAVAGYAEAVEVLAIVRAARKPVGVYELDDVLVEFAVARSDAVSGRLVSIIRSLKANPTLFDTLAVLLKEEHNRNRAAAELFIHRSTLDYRLGRIEEITGYHPLSRRGAQVFSLAMTMFALS